MRYEHAVGPYRYRLGLKWGTGRSLLWIMLNPSTADAERDDPTMRRVIRFSRDWGFPGCEIVNLYAYRTPSPKVLAAERAHVNVVGPENDEVVCKAIAHAPSVLCAWGSIQDWMRPRAHEVVGVLRDTPTWVLGRTKRGDPRHPLYVPAETQAERVLF